MWDSRGVMTNLERTREIFELKTRTGSNERLLAALADDARWTIAGSCRASRLYHGKSDLLENCLEPLGRRLRGAVRSRVAEILDSGETTIVRWRGEAETKWGERYDNDYCWVLGWAEGRIVRVVAYLDTLLLERVMAHPE
jgi:ketosteroid isomerase-like protein